MTAMEQPDLGTLSRHLSHGDYAELYAEDSRGTGLTYEDGRVDEIQTGEARGIALRFIAGEETRFGHVDGWEDRAVERLSRDLSAGLTRRTGGQVRTLSQNPRTERHEIRRDPSEIPLEEKVRLLSRAEAAARAHPRAGVIRQISLTYGERRKTVAGVSLNGGNGLSAFSEERVYLVFAATVVAESGGVLQTATEVLGALAGYELFDANDPCKIAVMAADRAIRKLSAPPAPVGEMPVVLESEAGGTMIHEAIGHSLEADGVQKGISPVYSGKVGKTVAHEKVTVVDDPTLKNHRGSFIFDDEGTRSERTVLVEKGVLRTYLYDRLTAGKDGRPSNGHGRRESYQHKPIPRMSNTFIGPGPDDPRDILASVPKGLLVRRMGGGQ
ncbi:MAG: hypothetical protein A2636_01690, partial [Elusimicrobia bacterium RIFCSPHIGHO2_01_FULL_64_10]